MLKQVIFILLIGLLVLPYVYIFPFTVLAASNQTIEQQINIINQDVTTQPGSAGDILLDTTKYNSATYYFEVIAKVTSGGNGSIDLSYNAGTGANPSGGTTTTIGNITATSFQRYRSSAFIPTGAQNAQIKNLTCTGCTLTIHAARVIIVQSDPVAITQTETQIDIGEFSTTFTNTTDTPADDSKFWKFDSSKYSNITHIYFEATIQQTNPGGGNIAYESLYTAGSSCTSQVSGSEVSTNINNVQRTRSGDLLSVLTSGTTYMICARTSPAGKVLEKGARIIIDQSSPSGISAMEIPITFNIDKIQNATSTLTSFSYNNLFEANNWLGETTTFYYEATLKETSGGDTATAQVCYQQSTPCDTTVGNAIVNTTTTLSLVRSIAFSQQPPNGIELDNGLQDAQNTHNVTVMKGDLIVDVTPLSSSAVSVTSSTTIQATNNIPDPNILHGWKKKIHAGPHHIGSIAVINASGVPASQNAGTIIPDSASHIDVYVSVQKNEPSALLMQPTPIPFPWQQGLNTAGNIYQYTAVSSFNGYPVQQFDNPVTIILSYDPSKLYGLSPSLLRIAWFNQATNMWQVIPNNTVINTQSNTIANTTKQFSYFTVVYPSSAFY